MQSDARRSGVILMPISAFRAKATQEKLFFEVKEQRNQETRKRAEVSAPPGYRNIIPVMRSILAMARSRNKFK